MIPPIRIMPCLDMQNGRVVKGVHFVDIRDAGDRVEWAEKVDSFGVPVILPTSKAGDGARTGCDLPVIRAMSQATKAQKLKEYLRGRGVHVC